MSEHTPGPCPQCGVNASEVMPLVVKLRLQRDELLAALEAVEDAINSADLDGTVLWINPPHCAKAVHETASERLAAALKAAKGEL